MTNFAKVCSQTHLFYFVSGLLKIIKTHKIYRWNEKHSIWNLKKFENFIDDLLGFDEINQNTVFGSLVGVFSRGYTKFKFLQIFNAKKKTATNLIVFLLISKFIWNRKFNKKTYRFSNKLITIGLLVFACRSLKPAIVLNEWQYILNLYGC